jgi:hypothetical protein
MDPHHTGSLVALAAGIVLVFAGLSAALGFSITGMIASAAAIAALLYAGGVWLGAPSHPADSQVVLFTPGLTVATGPSAGRPIGELFPDSTRAAIEEHCRLALEGRTLRFTVPKHGVFAASPVRCPEGAVVYGLLLSGQTAEAAASELMSVS